MEIVDIVWFNENAKWNNCIERIQQNTDTIIITWFEETWHKLESIFKQANISSSNLFPCRQVTQQHVKDYPVIFAEHYPLHEKEEELYRKIHLERAEVYSSLDEPIFKDFGNEKIMELLKKMGCNENEPIQNTIINTAIKRAQEKIASVVSFEIGATSQAGWLMRNLTA